MAVKLGNGNWAVKEDKLLAYNDNSGLFFNKEFDFSRGSTATYVGRDGLIASAASGVPRIDFTNDTKGHLLLEPSTTNLVPYSEDFSTWSLLGGIGTVTYVSDLVNPDGSVGGYKIGGSGIYVGIGLPSTAQRSIYARSVSGSGNAQLMSHNSNTNNVFTLTEKWQRFDLNSSPLVAGNFYVDLRGSETTLDEIYVWGANATNDQDYPTSYIPTTGAASTRNADVCNNSGSAQDFNSEEGVLYAEIANIADDGTNKRISINDGTISNRLIFQYRSTSNEIVYYFVVGGVNQCALIYTLSDATQFSKIALKYKTNDFAIWVDGNEVITDTSGSTMSKGTLNTLDFDGGTGSNDFYGKVRNVQVFTEALTDEQLEKLTS